MISVVEELSTLAPHSNKDFHPKACLRWDANVTQHMQTASIKHRLPVQKPLLDWQCVPAVPVRLQVLRKWHGFDVLASGNWSAWSMTGLKATCNTHATWLAILKKTLPKK